MYFKKAEKEIDEYAYMSARRDELVVAVDLVKSILDELLANILWGDEE